jgi:hypothetical protein
MSLSSDITAVVNDILAADFLGDVPGSSIAQLSPSNLGNGAWSKFQLSGGGDAVLTPSSIDGILCKLIVAGNIHIVSDYSGTTGRIKVTTVSGSGTEIYHSTQQSVSDTAFYEEILLFYASISGNTNISEVTNFNLTSTIGSYAPGSSTPALYISGGFDYTGSATYNSSNHFNITEFRLISA